MKSCPKCNRNYSDDTLSFCLECGSPLIGSFSPSQAKTEVMYQTPTTNVQATPTTQQQPPLTQQPQYQSTPLQRPSNTLRTLAIFFLAILSILSTLSAIIFFALGIGAAALNAEDTTVGVFVLIAMFIPLAGTLFGLIALYLAFRKHGGKGVKWISVIAILLNLLYVLGFVGLMLLGAINNYMEGKF
jgi:hypothetical protein